MRIVGVVSDRLEAIQKAGELQPDRSEKTVEFHRHQIMDVCKLKSNADLVLFALKRGLISVNIEPHPHVEASQNMRQ